MKTCPLFARLLLLAAVSSTSVLPALAKSSAPANDNVAAAQVLSGNFVQINGTLVGASKEIGEDPDNDLLGSVWYAWTAPQSGFVSFGASFDPSGNNGWTVASARAYVQTSSDLNVFNLKKLNATADSQGFTVSNIRVAPTQVIYFYVASGRIANLPEAFTAALNFSPIYASNDNAGGAALLTGNSPSASGALVDATRESGEPASTGNNTLWWKWTAPSNGTTTFSAAASDDPATTVLSVFTGTKVTNLAPAMSQTGGAGFSLSTTAGGSYLIAIGTTSTSVFGTAVLSIAHAPAPGTPGGGGATLSAGGRFFTTKKTLGFSDYLVGTFTRIDEVTRVTVTASGNGRPSRVSLYHSLHEWAFIHGVHGRFRKVGHVTYVVRGYSGDTLISITKQQFRVRRH